MHSYTSYTLYGIMEVMEQVNNAGVVSTTVDEESFWSIDLPSEVKDEKAKEAKKTVTQTFEGAQKCMETNYYGAKHVTQALLTLLLKSNSPRVVNVSSKLGQLEKGWSSNVSGYIVSKAALNAYTRILAKKYPSLCANAVSPGFVATDMSFFKGTSTAEEGARGPVRLDLMPDGGPSGQIFWTIQDSPF
ncbi:putative short-chain dehydrogenase/reductase SDR, NAD(P)-binding domain superfamily [Helianthus anomalus]